MTHNTRWWTFGGCLGLLLLLIHTGARAQSLEERVEQLERQVGAGKATLSIPAWVDRLTFSGDFRLRYQYDDTDEVGDTGRHRGRYRYRLGIAAKIFDPLKVGFGIASGGDDPRSTNQTLDNSFSSKGIRIDLAYAEYQPIKGLKITGGKFKNPIWRPSDLLWDGDIRPEGGSLLWSQKVMHQLGLFFGMSVFILDERSNGADPLMIPIQGGVDINFAKNVSLKFAATYYEFLDVQGTTLDFSAGTNTLNNAGVLQFDYDAVSLSAELGLKHPFGEVIPYIGLFGDYVNNFDPSRDNEGFLAGIKIGDKSVKKGGQWQVKYLYRRLERDAWLDVLPDSDFAGGGTNAKGHEFIVVYGIVKDVSMGIDYYHTQQIKGGDLKEDVFQFDVMFKF